MSLRNRKLSHLEQRPCRRCGTPTSALVAGVLQTSPMCPGCKSELHSQFQAASAQRARQDIAGRRRHGRA